VGVSYGYHTMRDRRPACSPSPFWRPAAGLRSIWRRSPIMSPASLSTNLPEIRWPDPQRPQRGAQAHSENRCKAAQQNRKSSAAPLRRPEEPAVAEPVARRRSGSAFDPLGLELLEESTHAGFTDIEAHRLSCLWSSHRCAIGAASEPTMRRGSLQGFHAVRLRACGAFERRAWIKKAEPDDWRATGSATAGSFGREEEAAHALAVPG